MSVGAEAARNEADPSAALRAIEAGWRTAITRAQHPPRCACCFGLAFLPDPDALAEDIEHGLRRRHAGARRTVPRLLDDHPPLPGEPFPARLARIAAADPAGAGVILSDVLETLHSIGEAARPLRLRIPGARQEC